MREQRLAEYAAKKAGKVKPAAKSVVTMEVKPWDDETDLGELEKSVRSIEQDGLVWGKSQLIAIGYGIKKLQINLVIEDDKVGLDDLQETIAEFEDYVQSSDIVRVFGALRDLMLTTCRLRCKSCRWLTCRCKRMTKCHANDDYCNRANVLVLVLVLVFVLFQL